MPFGLPSTRLDIGNEGNGSSRRLNSLENGGRVHVGNGDTNDIAACLLKSEDLSGSSFKIVSGDVRHRLNADGSASADKNTAYVYLS